MDLDTPLRYRPGGQNVPVARATAAIEYCQTEGIHITWLERCVPSVEGELADCGSVNGSRALRLTAIAVGYYPEVPTGAFEDDVTGIVVELQVTGRNCRVIRQVLGIESEGDWPGTRRVGQV